MAMYNTVTIGEARVDIIADGVLPVASAELYQGIPEELRAGRLPDAGDGQVLAPIHVALVRTGGETMLIDAGMGQMSGEGGHGGDLLAALVELGVAPGDVTRVLITHLHGDHLLGLLDRSSGEPRPTFPNARHHLSRIDWEWVEGFPAERRDAYLDPLRGLPHLTLDTDDQQPATIARYISTPGHTPGHRAVLIESDEARFCFIGDLAHDPELQFADPARVTAWDALPERTIASRRDFAAQARAGNWQIAATHATFPPLGRLGEAEGAGWRWLASQGWPG